MTSPAFGCIDDEDNGTKMEDSDRVESGTDSSADAGTDVGPIEWNTPADESAVLNEEQMGLPPPTGPASIVVATTRRPKRVVLHFSGLADVLSGRVS